METRPGVGYPRHWKDQEKWKGGWTLDNSGKLALSTGSKSKSFDEIILPSRTTRVEGLFPNLWTYDYETLIHGGRKTINQLLVPFLVTKQKWKLQWG